MNMPGASHDTYTERDAPIDAEAYYARFGRLARLAVQAVFGRQVQRAVDARMAARARETTSGSYFGERVRPTTGILGFGVEHSIPVIGNRERFTAHANTKGRDPAGKAIGQAEYEESWVPGLGHGPLPRREKPTHSAPKPPAFLGAGAVRALEQKQEADRQHKAASLAQREQDQAVRQQRKDDARHASLMGAFRQHTKSVHSAAAGATSAAKAAKTAAESASASAQASAASTQKTADSIGDLASAVRLLAGLAYAENPQGQAGQQAGPNPSAPNGHPTDNDFGIDPNDIVDSTAPPTSASGAN